MHRVVWSQRALGDLVGIRDYVSEFAPMAARRLALRLIAAAESLSEHPLRGRSAGGGRRVLVAIPPYLIRYRIVGETVEIITIRHGARRIRGNGCVSPLALSHQRPSGPRLS